MRGREEEAEGKEGAPREKRRIASPLETDNPPGDHVVFPRGRALMRQMQQGRKRLAG